MRTRQIDAVIDNMDKKYTYANHKGRYQRAMRNGFYFEALMIDYALMEDRLRSFIYHAGIIQSRTLNKIDCSKKNKRYLKAIYRLWITNENANLPQIGSIMGKVNLIRAITEWTSTTTEIPDDNRYLLALKSQCESVDIDALLNDLKRVEDWCNYRNEVVHALMNKNINSLNKELYEKVTEGMEIANSLDTYVRDMKKGNKVRRAANLEIEKD